MKDSRLGNELRLPSKMTQRNPSPIYQMPLQTQHPKIYETLPASLDDRERSKLSIYDL